MRCVLPLDPLTLIVVALFVLFNSGYVRNAADLMGVVGAGGAEGDVVSHVKLRIANK